MKYLCCTFYNFNFSFVLQTVDDNGYHTIEGLHPEVVVVVLFKHCRRIDEMRGVLAVIAVNIVTSAELIASTGNGSVFGVGLDTFNEFLNSLCRELQCIFLVS